jgi:diaminopimelate epimerase
MRFSKWHALGNAYLLVERADLRDPLTPALVELLCDPRFGVGSTGSSRW